MARLRSCAAEHDRAGVGPVDGTREAIEGEFRNETSGGRDYISSVGLRWPRDSPSFCPAIALKSISVESRVSAFNTFDIYASAC
mgnify:CR=1 FL=1